MSSIDSAGINSQIPLQAKYPDIGGTISDNMSKAFELQDLYKQRQLQQQQLQFQNQSEMQRLGMEHERLNLENKRLDQQTALQNQLYEGQRASDRSDWMSNQMVNAWATKEQRKQELILSGVQAQQAEQQALQEVAPMMKQIKVAARDAKDSRGAPLFDPQTLQRLDQAPEQFDDAKLMPMISSNPKASQRMIEIRTQLVNQKKLALEERSKAPPTRNVIHGEKEQTEQFDPQTQTWKPIGEPGPRFAAQVINVNQQPPSLPAGSENKTGEDFLKTLPTAEQQSVKMIANYQEDPSFLSKRNNRTEKLLAEAKLYDPDFDPSQYKQRQKVVSDFKSGPTSKNITSINTAIGHLNTLSKLSDAMKNGDSQTVNQIVNTVKTQFGNPNVNNFQTAGNAVADELMKTFRGAGASETEAERWGKSFASKGSPEQMHGAIKTAAELLNSRINALQDQWKRGMGTDKDFPNLLSPHSAEALAELEKAGPSGPAAPKAGDVQQGYRFKGGDPGKKENWEKV